MTSGYLFRRPGIEKHQNEKHSNFSYDIETLRELSLAESENLDSELRSINDGTGTDLSG